MSVMDQISSVSQILYSWQINLQSSAPCVGELIVVLLHAFFLGILLLQLLHQGIRKACQRWSTEEGKDLQKHLRETSSLLDINLGITYKGTIACCSLLLILNLLTPIWLLFVGQSANRYCKSQASVISAQVTQGLSSFIALVVVFNFQRARSIVIPWILRAWWICSLPQSVICMLLDVNSVTAHHDPLGIKEYASFLNSIIYLYLFLFAIRGKTGINISSSGITDPLLQKEQGNDALGERQPSPYGRANIIQLVTFSWINPLISLGVRKSLDQEDVPDIDIHDSAEFVSHVFDDCLGSQKAVSRDHSLYKAIYLFIRKKAAINALFAITTASVSYVGPYLINDFVKFLSGRKESDTKSGYILALAFFSAKLMETVCQRQWIFGARQLGLRLRAALISRIYKKGLHLSSQARQSHTSGEIINYMSVDIQRITDFVWYLNVIFMFPIQISLSIYILSTTLGLGSMAALAATAIVMACNIPITRAHKYFQSKIMEAKDNRMKSTAEVLRNIKTIKLQAWDIHYSCKLEQLRKIEYEWLSKSLRLAAVSAFIFWGSPTFVSIITFGSCILMGIPLTAGRVLSALATIRMLQEPIYTLPDLLSVLAQAKVSIDRVNMYFQEDELKPDAVEIIPRDVAVEFAIEIKNGDFSWDPSSKTPTLSGINLQVKKGMRVAICGTVGSGKSSLLSSVLGEIPKLSGMVKLSGTKAYVPQSPWILTGNIRDNILFGNEYEHLKYDQTIRACDLTKDLELFSEGDLTEIGERGITMSGGQKQRIQLARAVYQDADIYLLDDPFSAVDAHTGTHLFQDCLMRLLKEKTVLYVTHQVEFLPAADLIVVMQNGKITHAGKFEELLQQSVGFELLVGAHNQALETVLTVENSSRLVDTQRQGSTESTENELEPTSRSVTGLPNGTKHNLKQDICQESTNKGKLLQDEEREKGSIGREVYLSYLRAVWHGGLIPFILIAQSIFQALQVGSNYWIAWASPPTDESEKIVSTATLFQVYIFLSVGSALCVLVRAILVSVFGLLTAQKLFTDMLRSVLHAPMSFFDSTPTGRILNRASTDQSVLDLEIAGRLAWSAFSVIQILGTIVVMSQVAWQVFAIFIPVTAICIWYQRYYTPTARELARLAGTQRSPILHHFAESISGAATIRAFNQEDRFIVGNLNLTDAHSRPWFHNMSATEWLCFRLNILSNLVFVFALMFLVSLPDGAINPSIAGLAVTYALNLNIQQASIIWNMCNAENKMISVERILQYSKITSEAPFVIEECRPPKDWPSDGSISLKNLEIRYAEHLPSVLRNITCTFPGKRKIGIVGRTGSGKSTLIQALFRIVEPRSGSIVIDGVDVGKLGLHDLRSRLSIIPQDPTMFEGTIRGNLDPLQQHTDMQIWEALEKCQLGETVREKKEKLESPVVENGENWSVGQRQLVCLGRTLLKRSSVLVLDEATASVDTATDGVIQQIIRREFRDCTVITIAHRIHTVIDSDLVLVLSQGIIVEYDSPARLLERRDSSFSKLIAEYSLRSKGFNNLVGL
ncbi:putative ABC transporter C family member 15 [Nymphaea colorata]|nr:putative ABC transporter C family member 15 [Nymphaea colorata]XP_049933314.1 putative ABC transporter C family member 15 [Nymphaea colorata]XP_049933315.1 putative ABC transporter C family member 15 [Nymphaea colorata]XP_049933316.1 putative ABC transporter C family member 15 [Nymphaea colorata]XP_049933317.1 putative ABC transporter C family member 15 [Nymphaea colorata]